MPEFSHPGGDNQGVTAGGKLFLVGLAVAAAGAAFMAVQGDVPHSAAALETDQQAGGLAAGATFMAVACFVYVLQPALKRGTPAQTSVATVRTSVAMLVVATVVANIISLPVALRLAHGGAVGAGGLAFLIAVSELPLIGVVWLRLVVPRAATWRELGLKARPVVEHIARGLVGGGALFVTAAVVGAALTRAGVRQNQFERFAGIQGAPPGLFLLAAAAGCVLAPFAEELFFRGYVFRTFSARYGRPWAYLFSAGLFAVVHANLAAAAPIFVLGLMLAYIFQETGSILPGAIAHGVNNAIAFALLYAGITG